MFKKILVFCFVTIVIRANDFLPFTPKYQCVQYQNNDFPSYKLNSCQLYAFRPVGMTGWSQTGNIWDQFDCHNCNNATLLGEPNEKAGKVNQIKTLFVDDDPKTVTSDDSPNDMFPCCYYSDPDHSYIEPMHEVGLNPAAGKISCERIDEGLTVFAQFSMDSMWNCIAFEYED